MKKLLAFMGVLMLLLSLTACGNKTPAVDLPLSNFADILDLGEEANTSTVVSDNTVVMVFNYDEKPYRASAKLSDDVYEKLINIDIFADDGEEQMRNAFLEIPIQTMEDLSLKIPSQESLNKYVGKKAMELVDEGFSPSGYYAIEDNVPGTVHFDLDRGLFTYDVLMEEGLSWDEEYDDYLDMLPMFTVKEITYKCVSDYATDLSVTE